MSPNSLCKMRKLYQLVSAVNQHLQFHLQDNMFITQLSPPQERNRVHVNFWILIFVISVVCALKLSSVKRVTIKCRHSWVYKFYCFTLRVMTPLPQRLPAGLEGKMKLQERFRFHIFNMLHNTGVLFSWRKFSYGEICYSLWFCEYLYPQTVEFRFLVQDC